MDKEDSSRSKYSEHPLAKLLVRLENLLDEYLSLNLGDRIARGPYNKAFIEGFYRRLRPVLGSFTHRQYNARTNRLLRKILELFRDTLEIGFVDGEPYKRIRNNLDIIIVRIQSFIDYVKLLPADEELDDDYLVPSSPIQFPSPSDRIDERYCRQI